MHSPELPNCRRVVRGRRLAATRSHSLIESLAMSRNLLWTLGRLVDNSRRLLAVHYAFGASFILLVTAAAVALGAFGWTDGPSHRVASPAVTATPADPTHAATSPLTLTYFVVSSEEYRAALDSVENQLVHREWLGRSLYEVLVVSSADDFQRALQEVEAARLRLPSTRVLIEDLRAP
jgi:hypothetical protein